MQARQHTWRNRFRQLAWIWLLPILLLPILLLPARVEAQAHRSKRHQHVQAKHGHAAHGRGEHRRAGHAKRGMPPSFEADAQPGRCNERRKPARFRDTAATYAARNRISVATFLALNHLPPNATVVHGRRYVMARGAFGERLVDGESLGPSTADIIVVNPSRAWGQRFVVSLLRKAAHRVQEQSPGPRLVIEDISIPQGGCLAPHREHRGGREVDAGLYHKTEVRRLARGAPGSFDARREWLFLRTLIETGLVDSILLDRMVQAQLYKAAKQQRTPPERLRKWLQWHGDHNAIIRHAGGHDNHTHIKFRCPAEGCPAQPDLAPAIELMAEATATTGDEQGDDEADGKADGAASESAPATQPESPPVSNTP